MVRLDLTDREARIIAALCDHHVQHLTTDFVEGTVTWTTQLNVDPQLAVDVVGVVTGWLADVQSVRGRINRQLLHAQDADVADRDAGQPERGNGNDQG